jgi:uncharacterized protein YigE (DUF2233 family)
MQTLLRVILIAASALSSSFDVSAEPSSGVACETRELADVGYTLCSVDPKIGRLQLFWRREDRRPYRTFSAVAQEINSQGKSLAFAMNAGMYTDDFSPMGLYVEDRQELRPLNTIELKSPSGVVPNFYKKPNGVFFVDEKGPGILPTSAFRNRRNKAVFATQSGPMLLIDGKTNPIFIPGSKDRTRRSGVGLCEGGTVRFAISDGPVNFHDFAELFRRELKCSDALFLDGGRGAGIYVPAMGREDWSGHGGYGPIIGLVE